MEETDQNGVAQVVFTQSSGLYGDLVSQRLSGATSYFLFDPLGSTTRLTNAAQAVTDTYLMKSFGDILLTGTTTNPFLFNGRVGYYLLPDPRQYSVGQRIFAPTLGRWILTDRARFIDGPNLFMYVRNRPTRFSDPSGEAGCRSNFCSTVGPLGRSEGTNYASASVSAPAGAGNDSQCDEATLHIQIINSMWMGTRRVRQPAPLNPADPVGCGEPANSEIAQVLFHANAAFGVDSIHLFPFPCSRPRTIIRKDCHGCYILEWNIDCEIDCENGACAPQQFYFNIHGPYTSTDDPFIGTTSFGISAYSLNVDVDVSFSMHCPCLFGNCNIDIGMQWIAFKATGMNPVTGFPVQAVSPIKPDCLEADLSELSEAYGCSKVVKVQ